MIPKIIHYCWFGGNPLPKLAKDCIKSWKKYFPEFEIMEWNETNFNVNIIPYTEEAYKAKKYAFVSDYARFYILYHYGGLYFDTDVEVLRPMEHIIQNGPFMGCEFDAGVTKSGLREVAPGLGLGAERYMSLYKEILDFYSNLHFIDSTGALNTITVVDYITNLFREHGLVNNNLIVKCCDVHIYPTEYFCPVYGRNINFTKNTCTIHHYMASWKRHSLRKKIVMLIQKIIIRYYKLKLFSKL